MSERWVLLVTLAPVVSADALRRTVELADGGEVAVLALPRIHGYAFGLPNPGLMPTAKERADQVALVAGAIEYMERHGLEADGQVTATRKASRVIIDVAITRHVRHVVIDQPPAGKIRRALEGDPAAAVRRRIGTRAEVVVVEAIPANS